MTLEEVLAYLETWAKVNVHEVFGSSREFIHIDSLTSEIDKLREAAKR